ncbi:integrase core domain-containing protein, partial [Mycobacterium tuberculosis]|uniref:integrase core domain-containing protein n=1 Tax=Mycobacterium tuberculosis TaxID=1773 RepID=UPI000A4F1150
HGRHPGVRGGSASRPAYRRVGAGGRRTGDGQTQQAIWTRQQEGVLDLKDVIHHTDRGSQYTSIRFSERLAEAGIQPSVGAVGSSYDNALAETINGLYKTELIKPGKPWRSIEDVELATARWVDWFNHRRLYQYCGDVPPVELEAAYYAQRQRPAAG